MGKIYKNGIEYGGGGGGSAGHIILDNDGTAMAKEPSLQFKGLNVTDNSTDEVTEVESAGLNQDSMDDVTSGGVSNTLVANSNVYSTNEQVVGKWIDGKPIYQKTYITTTPSVANSNEDVCPLGVTVDELVSLDGIVTLVSSGNKLRYPVNNAIGVGTTFAGDYRACWLRPTTIAMNVSSQCTNLTVHITIRYTKTTD